MTITEALKAAVDGDVIDWTGETPISGLKNIDKAVTIRGATFAGGARILGCKRLTIEDFAVNLDGPMTSATNVLGVEACEGVTLIDGNLTANSGNGRGLLIARSKGIRTLTIKVSGTARGVYVDLSSDVTLFNTLTSNLRSDGVDISRSQFVTIDGLVVENVDVGASDAHPDVVQIINSPTNPGICSDITIRGVRARTMAQGICLFDHDRGGADRVTIEDVEILTSFYHGIHMENVRGLTLRDIKIGPLPGTAERIKPWVMIPGCTDIVQENVVTGWDGRATVAPVINPVTALLDEMDALTAKLRAAIG